MAYEFKKLSNVAVAETAMDTANVLIEEEGVIKRVPKSEVGGGMVVTFSGDDPANLVADKTVDEIVMAVENGARVSAKMTQGKTTKFFELSQFDKKSNGDKVLDFVAVNSDLEKIICNSIAYIYDVGIDEEIANFSRVIVYPTSDIPS